jgi:hypothetical protein
MLLAAIADLALVALIVALSPFPLVASIIAASAANPANGPAFAAGWTIGLALLTAIVVAAAGEADLSTVAPDAWVQILVGAALLAAALRKWRMRPIGDAPPKAPGWMSSLDRGPARTFGMGAALGGVNPKHLAVAAAAAAIIQYHGLSGSAATAAAVAFLAVGSSTVFAIVLAAVLGGPATARALASLKGFMLRHNTSIMVVLFAVIGAKLVVEGVSILRA